MRRAPVPLIVVLLLASITTGLAAEEGSSWPQEIEVEGGVVTLYQPQIESLTDVRVEARAAVSWKSAAAEGPAFGAVWLAARLETDRSTRFVRFVDLEIPKVVFPESEATDRDALAALLEREAPTWRLELTLDELVATLDGEGAPAVEGLRHEPPKLRVVNEPTILVLFDGDPTFQPMENAAGLERAVNTPFLVVREGSGGPVYLAGGGDLWYRADGPLGPWSVSRGVPQKIATLAIEEDQAGAADETPELADAEPPAIVVATEPTELIVIAGAARWSLVEGTEDLLYLDNTDSDVFLDIPSQQYYVAVSGRWYRSPAIAASEYQPEWVANDALPASFADVAEGSVNGSVLAHVAGTEQAREAMLENTVPQTAAIRRDDSSAEARYDGQPTFEAVEGAEGDLRYAVNTSQAVFKSGSKYYLCEQGVWYVATAATGPWSVAASVPPEVYSIPPSNPHHNVTYVRVYDVTPQVVYVGYTPSYTHSYVSHGCVVWGTGWRYHPWYGPHYYARPWTWGVRVRYDPWYGWSFGLSWSNGPFTFSFGWGSSWYGSHWGGWWGPGGYRPGYRPWYRPGYHKPRPVHPIHRPTTFGGRPQRPSQMPATADRARPNLYDRPGNSDRLAARPATSDRKTPRPTTRPNDVLTDRSGNVYRRDESGQWNRREGGSWRPAEGLDRPSQMPERPTTRPSQPSTRPQQPSQPSTRPPQPSQRPATRPQLERDMQHRQRGMQRNRGNPGRPSGGRPAPRPAPRRGG